MIPSSFQRGSRGGRRNLPMPLVVAGAVGAVIVVVFLWVILSMGAVPVTEPVTADVAVTL